MSPKTEFEWRRIFREMAERCCCFTMCVQVMILLEIYKWTSMGPDLFQQKILVTKSTSYQMLQLGWSQGILPLVKWLPIALLADVFFPESSVGFVPKSAQPQTQDQTVGLAF